jgi:hypothetical protein
MAVAISQMASVSVVNIRRKVQSSLKLTSPRNGEPNCSETVNRAHRLQ